ncbi:hypothetical protein [Treponema zioleckii]|uniref:hypothetical protein n=1 Tax=Treponema zioleckii TaxID=331680 RepID=UPI00168AA5A3|nr:hypothetical protein [Treponema zioleckii]
MIIDSDDFIVYAIYNGDANYYITFKELWYLDYRKLRDATIIKMTELALKGDKYAKNWKGWQIGEVNEIRRDTFEMTDAQIPIFIKRIENDIFSVDFLKEIYEDEDNQDYLPSLYVDFDNHIFYSIYREPASFEDYVPDGWISEYKDFYYLIPDEEKYWIRKENDKKTGILYGRM